jgi:hypothetical protein
LRLQGAQALPASARRAQPASEGERAQWQRLLAALQVSDMVALELHAELRQHMDALTDPQIDSTLEALDQAMAELDFDVAAAVCEKLVRQWDTEEARTLT